jgi:hypothetical protein
MVTDADRHRFCQRGCDLIDLEDGAFVEKPCTDIAPLMPATVRSVVMEHDREAERILRDRGQRREVTFASCAGLAGDSRFTTAMRKILHALQEAYDYAVDIEFTVNVDTAGGQEIEPRFVINLLQCRPLQSFKGTGPAEVPAATGGPVLLRAADNTMGGSVEAGVDFVCMVDAAGYRACPHAKRPGVARAVGEAGHRVREAAGANAILLAPGRIGTSSPDLGVPVTFAEISNFRAIVEYADATHGFSPELSYGSHMFQDLVEENILYCAVLERGTTVFDRSVLDGLPQVGLDAAEAGPDIASCVHLFDARGRGLGLWHDLVSGQTLIAFA